jgi:hypothetical protein
MMSGREPTSLRSLSHTEVRRWGWSCRWYRETGEFLGGTHPFRGNKREVERVHDWER